MTKHPAAQRAGEQPTTDCFGAFALRAPETIIGSDFGPGVDIWAVGCIVGFPSRTSRSQAQRLIDNLHKQTFELLVGRWLFHPEEGEDWTAEDDHLAKMLELTGQSFPESMLQRAKRRKDFFDDAGAFLARPPHSLCTMESDTAVRYYECGLHRESTTHIRSHPGEPRDRYGELQGTRPRGG